MNVETFINNVNAKEKHLGHNKFQLEIKKMSDMITNYDIIINDKNQKITMLEKDISELNDVITEQKHIMKQMSQKEENDLLEKNSSFTELKNTIINLKNENDEIKEKLMNLENTNIVLTNKFEEKCKILERSDNIIQDLKQQLVSLESYLSTAVNYNNALKLQIDELSSELNMVKILNDKLIEENKTLRSVNKEIHEL